MRRSWLLVMSAAVNIVLLAVLLSLKGSRPVTTGGGMAEQPTATTPGSGSKVNTVVRRQFFTWSEVESPDYPVYIGRLREIGCPEQTIRDIVVADVNQLYDRKRLDEVPTTDQEWWRSTPDTNLTLAAQAKEQSLDRERRALLDTLLGTNWNVAEMARASLPLNGPVLGKLSPEVGQAVRDIVARGQKQMEALSSTNGGRLIPTAAVAGIERQIRAELAKVLTPAQLEEFLLRYSLTAATLRTQLKGFAITPDQFRKMFELRDPVQQQLDSTDTSMLSTASRAALEKQLDDAIKTALGPDAYQQFKLSQDPDYRDAAALVAANDAPTNLVDQLYQVKLLTKQEEDRINADPTLTPNQKAAQIKSIEQQSQAFSDQLLGVAPAQPAPLPVMPPPPPPMAIHPYQMGETIGMIAARYGVTQSSIIAANPDLNIDAIASGTPIKVPLRQPPAPAAP